MASISKLRERYIALFGEEGAGDAIRRIEDRLGVGLPSDFKDVAKFYSGGLLGGISHNAIACEGNATTIVGETERLRQATRVPERFVVLAEPPESLIVLDTQPPAGKPAVIWLDAIDVTRLETASFLSPPDSWQSYADFFSTLLDDEEEERKEDEEENRNGETARF